MFNKILATFKEILSNYRKCFKIIVGVDVKFFVFILFSTVILGIAPSISIKFTQVLMNNIQTTEYSLIKILTIVGIYILFNLVISIFTLFSQFYTSLFEVKLDKEINLLILNKSGRLSFKSFEDADAYNKIQRAQTSNRIYGYCSYLISIVQLIITLSSYIVILFSWKWWTIIFILATALISTLLTNRVNKYRYNMLRARTENERKKWYYQYLLTHDLAFKEIKTYKLAQYFVRKYQNIYDDFIVQDKKYLKKSMLVNLGIAILDDIISGMILIMIIVDTFVGNILMGDSIAYINVTNNIKSTIKQLLTQLSLIYNDNLYISQLFEFLDMPEEKNEVPLVKQVSAINTISIKNLSYSYTMGKKYVLKNLNFELKKGEIVAVVGQNGAGKSTLIKILSALYDDYKGSIKINGIEMKELDKDSLRRQISILFQDFTKYELSLRENLAISNIEEKNDDSKLYKIMKRVDFKSNIDLEQQLGNWFEGGENLSGGEWIKVGIGRVLFKNSSMIILDEPNAALDAITEIEIFKSIKRMSYDKLCLIITHRISNIPFYADKVLVLDKGALVDFNTHDTLLKDCKLYKKLYEADLKVLH